MKQEDVKVEIISYVQVLETHYNDAIRSLRATIDRERAKMRLTNSDRVKEVCDKNELEQLFVECIEEIRKDIMKRRLKMEICNKKSYMQAYQQTQETKEFE
jgi:hypothetical protein